MIEYRIDYIFPDGRNYGWEVFGANSWKQALEFFKTEYPGFTVTAVYRVVKGWQKAFPELIAEEN